MISATGEYALRATVYLAQCHPAPKTSKDVFEATQVPSGYLSKVMQSLVQHGILKSQRGLHGGFTLTNEPDCITVLQILDAVGSAPERIKECPLGLKGHIKLCPVHKLLDESIQHTRYAFAKANLHELSKSVDGTKALCDE